MRTRHIVLAATLHAGGLGVAAAQTVATYDPSQLPAIQGEVAQCSLTPRGDVDGLILADGTEAGGNPATAARSPAAAARRSRSAAASLTGALN